MQDSDRQMCSPTVCCNHNGPSSSCFWAIAGYTCHALPPAASPLAPCKCSNCMTTLCCITIAALSISFCHPLWLPGQKSAAAAFIVGATYGVRQGRQSSSSKQQSSYNHHCTISMYCSCVIQNLAWLSMEGAQAKSTGLHTKLKLDVLVRQRVRLADAVRHHRVGCG